MNFQGPANTLLRSIGRPPFIYGTAWKKETTSQLVQDALTAGFTAIDTACQPRHYREDLVGDGLRAVLQQGKLRREDLFLQTKYTTPSGQDPQNTPYDATAPLTQQITTSLTTSLHNLRPHADPSSASQAYLDCLLLHSPLPTNELTLQAWQHLEAQVPHKIRALGISNTDLPTLRTLYDAATVKPAVVQNRFYPATRHDVALREFCRAKGIVYQSFWTLTGNPRLLQTRPVEELAKLAGVSVQVALYALVVELGVAVLNGTTNKGRMVEDLRDLERVRNWTFVYKEQWEGIVGEFKGLIGET